jgi:hypothetical protein
MKLKVNFEYVIDLVEDGDVLPLSAIEDNFKNDEMLIDFLAEGNPIHDFKVKATKVEE